MILEARTARLVKSQDLNHHRTLFAGRAAEWFTETCFIAAARFTGDPAGLVCVRIHGLTFTKPAHPGDCVEIVARIAHTGRTSVTVCGEIFINETPTPTVKGFATFVHVDADGKALPHGLSLPADYLARHRSLHEEALSLPRQG